MAPNPVTRRWKFPGGAVSGGNSPGKCRLAGSTANLHGYQTLDVKVKETANPNLSSFL